MWIDPETGDIAITHSDVRGLRPNWSGPAVMTDEMIAEMGFQPVVPAAPTYDPLRQTATEIAPAIVVDTWTQQWRIDDLDDATIQANLAAARAAMWELIKSERDRREYLGFQLGDHWFHSDMNSQVKYLGLKDKARDLLAAGGQPTDFLTEFGQTITWHNLDNSDTPVTAQLAFDLVTEIGKLQAMLYGLAKQHKAKMEADDHPDTYNYLTDWPAFYTAPAPAPAA